jgi:ribosomal-protein-alanine acetyltransferase
LRIRQATITDLPAMIRIERGSPTAAHWSNEQYEILFANPDNPQPSERFAWVVEQTTGDPEIASIQASTILGFLVAHRIDRDWELENIAVAEEIRRHGVGTRLLGELIAYARARQSEGIFLEVRASNHQARALYRRAGFEETGLRSSYYSSPQEDAIVCRLRL